MTDHERPEDRPRQGVGDEAPTEQFHGEAPTERLPAEPTERLHGTPTERLESHRQGTEPPPGQAAPAQAAAPWGPEDQRARETPRGPHAPTILLALICLAVAGLAIARQVTGFVGLTWTGSGPAIIVGAGVVLLAVGVLGLVRDRRLPRQR